MNMNVLDQIIASGFFVFDGYLNTYLVAKIIKILQNDLCVKFERKDLVMNEISTYMELQDNTLYVLKNGYTMYDIGPFINPGMVAIFEDIKKERDNYYSGKTKRKKSPFEDTITD